MYLANVLIIKNIHNCFFVWIVFLSPCLFLFFTLTEAFVVTFSELLCLSSLDFFKSPSHLPCKYFYCSISSPTIIFKSFQNTVPPYLVSLFYPSDHYTQCYKYGIYFAK